MQTVQATEDLVIELWPGGEVTDRPVLRVRSLSADAEGERQTVVIHLEEVRPLIEALVDAAAGVVELTVQGQTEAKE